MASRDISPDEVDQNSKQGDADGTKLPIPVAQRELTVCEWSSKGQQ